MIGLIIARAHQCLVIDPFWVSSSGRGRGSLGSIWIGPKRAVRIAGHAWVEHVRIREAEFDLLSIGLRCPPRAIGSTGQRRTRIIVESGEGAPRHTLILV